jgi:hypothetical protein
LIWYFPSTLPAPFLELVIRQYDHLLDDVCTLLSVMHGHLYLSLFASVKCGAVRDWKPCVTTFTEFGSPALCSTTRLPISAWVYINPSFQCALNKSLLHYTMLVEQRKLVDKLIAYALPGGSVKYWMAWRSNHSIAQTNYPQRPRCIAHHPPGVDLPITMTLLEFDPSRSSPHSRAALAVAHAVADSQYVSLLSIKVGV